MKGPRFELLRPHTLVLDGINRLVEAGTIVDAATIPDFCPTPAMRPLDDEARQLLVSVLERIRNGIDVMTNLSPMRGGKNVPGFGSLLGHVGGELEKR